MLYTLFFSTMRGLSPTEMDEYHERAGALKNLATAEHPGFVDIKTYVAEDGDRLTVARFRDAESQRGWKLAREHREAQARGRTHYYDRFRIVVCEEMHSHEFVRQAGDGA
jgi:heme-degrading monooxygenase HmoA